jgi:hypothetical protein
MGDLRQRRAGRDLLLTLIELLMSDHTQGYDVAVDRLV